MSQLTSGMIDKIYRPLTMPQSKPKAELIRRFNAKLLTINPFVPLLAVSALETIASAAPPS